MIHFQTGTFDPRPDLDRMLSDAYVWRLAAMDEPPLNPPAGRPATYRLLRLPAFSQLSLVKVTATGTGWRLTAKAGATRDGRRMDAPVRVSGRDLKPNEVRRLHRQVRRADFWAMPTAGPYDYLDGIMLLLEAVEEGRHHVVTRYEGVRRCDRFEALCRLLLRLGGEAFGEGWPVVR